MCERCSFRVVDTRFDVSVDDESTGLGESGRPDAGDAVQVSAFEQRHDLLGPVAASGVVDGTWVRRGRKLLLVTAAAASVAGLSFGGVSPVSADAGYEGDDIDTAGSSAEPEPEPEPEPSFGSGSEKSGWEEQQGQQVAGSRAVSGPASSFESLDAFGGVGDDVGDVSEEASIAETQVESVPEPGSVDLGDAYAFGGPTRPPEESGTVGQGGNADHDAGGVLEVVVEDPDSHGNTRASSSSNVAAADTNKIGNDSTAGDVEDSVEAESWLDAFGGSGPVVDVDVSPGSPAEERVAAFEAGLDERFSGFVDGLPADLPDDEVDAHFNEYLTVEDIDREEFEVANAGVEEALASISGEHSDDPVADLERVHDQERRELVARNLDGDGLIDSWNELKDRHSSEVTALEATASYDAAGDPHYSVAAAQASDTAMRMEALSGPHAGIVNHRESEEADGEFRDLQNQVFGSAEEAAASDDAQAAIDGVYADLDGVGHGSREQAMARNEVLLAEGVLVDPPLATGEIASVVLAPVDVALGASEAVQGLAAGNAAAFGAGIARALPGPSPVAATRVVTKSVANPVSRIDVPRVAANDDLAAGVGRVVVDPKTVDASRVLPTIGVGAVAAVVLVSDTTPVVGDSQDVGVDVVPDIGTVPPVVSPDGEPVTESPDVVPGIGDPIAAPGEVTESPVGEPFMTPLEPGAPSVADPLMTPLEPVPATPDGEDSDVVPESTEQAETVAQPPVPYTDPGVDEYGIPTLTPYDPVPGLGSDTTANPNLTPEITNVSGDNQEEGSGVGLDSDDGSTEPQNDDEEDDLTANERHEHDFKNVRDDDPAAMSVLDSIFNNPKVRVDPLHGRNGIGVNWVERDTLLGIEGFHIAAHGLPGSDRLSSAARGPNGEILGSEVLPDGSIVDLEDAEVRIAELVESGVDHNGVIYLTEGESATVEQVADLVIQSGIQPGQDVWLASCYGVCGTDDLLRKALEDRGMKVGDIFATDGVAFGRASDALSVNAFDEADVEIADAIGELTGEPVDQANLENYDLVTLPLDHAGMPLVVPTPVDGNYIVDQADEQDLALDESQTAFGPTTVGPGQGVNLTPHTVIRQDPEAFFVAAEDINPFTLSPPINNVPKSIDDLAATMIRAGYKDGQPVELHVDLVEARDLDDLATAMDRRGRVLGDVTYPNAFADRASGDVTRLGGTDGETIEQGQWEVHTMEDQDLLLSINEDIADQGYGLTVDRTWFPDLDYGRSFMSRPRVPRGYYGEDVEIPPTGQAVAEPSAINIPGPTTANDRYQNDLDEIASRNMYGTADVDELTGRVGVGFNWAEETMTAREAFRINAHGSSADSYLGSVQRNDEGLIQGRENLEDGSSIELEDARERKTELHWNGQDHSVVEYYSGPVASSDNVAALAQFAQLQPGQDIELNSCYGSCGPDQALRDALRRRGLEVGDIESPAGLTYLRPDQQNLYINLYDQDEIDLREATEETLGFSIGDEGLEAYDLVADPILGRSNILQVPTPVDGNFVATASDIDEIEVGPDQTAFSPESAGPGQGVNLAERTVLRDDPNAFLVSADAIRGISPFASGPDGTLEAGVDELAALMVQAGYKDGQPIEIQIPGVGPDQIDLLASAMDRRGRVLGDAAYKGIVEASDVSSQWEIHTMEEQDPLSSINEDLSDAGQSTVDRSWFPNPDFARPFQTSPDDLFRDWADSRIEIPPTHPGSVDGSAGSTEARSEQQLETGNDNKVADEGTKPEAGPFSRPDSDVLADEDLIDRVDGSGLHHRPDGADPVGARVLDDTIEAPEPRSPWSGTGAYQAEVELDGNDESNRSVSTFFPDRWSEVDVARAVESAFENLGAPAVSDGYIVFDAATAYSDFGDAYPIRIVFTSTEDEAGRVVPDKLLTAYPDLKRKP